METKIRYSTLKDAETLFKIWESAVVATHDFLTPEDIKQIGHQVRDYLKVSELIVLAAHQDTPLAFMGMTDSKIDSLFVDSKCFGKGYGKILVEYAFSKHAQLFVDVNEANDQARKFYERMNFVVIDRSEHDDEGRPFPILKMRSK